MINCLYVTVTNTKAYATLVSEHILSYILYCFISLLILINVISVNTAQIIIIVNSAR